MSLMIYYEEEGKALQKNEVLVMSMRHTKKGVKKIIKKKQS